MAKLPKLVPWGLKMLISSAQPKKVFVAIIAGVIVSGAAVVVDLVGMPLERASLLHQLMGDAIPGLLTTIVCLFIQLRQEELHYRAAIERAALLAELNHHIRNAVFPLSLVVQKLGDAEGVRIANDAMEKINIALKDATADALSKRVDYGENGSTSAARAA